MKLEFIFTEQYIFWNHEIYNASLDFYDKYNIYPNIMLASEITYNGIDNQLKTYGFGADGLRWDGDPSEKPPEFTGLSSFSTKDFTVEFCIDNEIKEMSFALVYDDDPSFDGEDIVDNPEGINHKRVFPKGKRTMYRRYKLAA
jgi:hypothetical protein